MPDLDHGDPPASTANFAMIVITPDRPMFLK
jgi:hypothetical protein